MNQYSISAIITCRNLHDYIGECVDSIKAQTMRVSEIIVLHDACGPPPVYPDTTTVVMAQQIGAGPLRNHGANLAQSDHLLFIDADDVIDEHFVEGMVNVKAETKADIIYPNVLLWSSWHKNVKLRNAWHESDIKITKEKMLDHCQLVVTSLIVKSLYLAVGGTPNIPILEDYALWMKCLWQDATFAKSPFSTLKYRQRANSRLRSSYELKNEWYQRIKQDYLGREEENEVQKFTV